MGEKARNGGTLGKAPLGYLNVRARDENGREIRTIALDEERAPLIRLAFTEYATGQWTTKRLAAHLHDRGLTTVPTARKPAKAVTGAQLHRMLRHPYYKGVISFQGVEYPGAHEPLVDEETWSQVQAVLDSHRFGERDANTTTTSKRRCTAACAVPAYWGRTHATAKATCTPTSSVLGGSELTTAPSAPS